MEVDIGFVFVFVFVFVQYLDSGVQGRSVLLLEAGSDVQHVHLAPRHHYPHQRAVIGSSTLNKDR